MTNRRRILTIMAFLWLVVVALPSVRWLFSGGFALAAHPSAVTISLPAFYWIWASHLLAIGLPSLAVALLMANRVELAALALGVLAANAMFGHVFVFGSPEWHRVMWPEMLLGVMTLAAVLMTLFAGKRAAGAS